MEEKKKPRGLKNDPERTKTVGQIAQELSQKGPEDNTIIDQARANLTDYEKNLEEAAKKGHDLFKDPYYVEILVKKETMVKNTLHCVFTQRQSCPTPFYDQIVYRCHWEKGDLEFLWSIPSLETCEVFKMFPNEVPKEEHQLLQTVLDFSNGTLLRKCKQLNGEKI